MVRPDLARAIATASKEQRSPQVASAARTREKPQVDRRSSPSFWRAAGTSQDSRLSALAGRPWDRFADRRTRLGLPV